MSKFLTICFFAVSITALPAGAADTDAGQETFTTYCQSCHGADGVGLLPQSPDFTLGERLEYPDMALLESVKGGKGIMPAMGSMLSEQQLLDTIAFIRTLRR